MLKKIRFNGIGTFKDKLKMYEMMIANLLAKDYVIEPDVDLGNSKISIEFSNVASETQISKYFVIDKFPDYMQPGLMDNIRNECINKGVRVNFFMYSQPHKIKWDSAEMRNKLDIWRNYTSKDNNEEDVFEYRAKRGDILAKHRIVSSTKYFNIAELDQRRTLSKIVILIEIVANRDTQSLLNMSESISRLKLYCLKNDIIIRELRVNMLDWLSQLGVMSLKNIREVRNRLSRKVLTDDIMATVNSYKQGRIGDSGACLGIDINSKTPVLKKIKEDPDAAENWLISAVTGGGKSYFVKSLLLYLLADNFVVTVMDYEGDEYYNLAYYLKAGNEEDVLIISMGKGSTIYFDPMEIADLTGDSEIDEELKETAINYTMSIFRVICAGLEKELNQWEERIISTAIKRVYERNGITEDKETWHKSKGIRIKHVYEEIKNMAESKEFVDEDTDSIKHKAAVKIAEGASTYFEEGEAKSGTFKNPMSVNELYKAKFIIFSFGMKGETASQTDPIVLALKQLSVANVSIQISNYCKYVKKCFNVKVWEEYQRWGNIKGSAEIITNAMTGGRKRGDVNFLITNSLQSILDDKNPVSNSLRENITTSIIGGIKDKDTREKFCKLKSVPEIEGVLEKIAKANDEKEKSGKGKNKNKLKRRGSKYEHAFCALLDNGDKAVIKVILPDALRKSKLFKTGVETKEIG